MRYILAAIVLCFWITAHSKEQKEVFFPETKVNIHTEAGGGFSYNFAPLVENPKSFGSGGVSCRCQYVGKSRGMQGDEYLVSFWRWAGGTGTSTSLILIAEIKIDYFGEKIEIRVKNMTCILEPDDRK